MTNAEKQLRKQLGASLRKARLERSLTQGDVAEVLGTDPETVSRFERGVTLPSLVRLMSLADALKVTLASLLGEASPRATDEWHNLVEAVGKLPDRDQKLAASLVKVIIAERGE